MLRTLQGNVQKAINNGKNRTEISEMESLGSAFYSDADVEKDFINGPKIRETIYDSLTAKME